MAPTMTKKMFRTRKSLTRKRECKDDTSGTSTKVKKMKGFPCKHCDKTFSFRGNMLRHIKAVHHVSNEEGKQLCPLCRCKVLNHELLRKHLLKCHKFPVETLELEFATLDDFFSWKKQEELYCKSLFVLKCGTKKLACGSKKYYYDCHRSGIFKTRGTGRRHLKNKGSQKAGITCSASIEMEQGAVIRVVYYKTHCGHDMKAEHLNLTKCERRAIADKLADGVPPEKILEDFRDIENDNPTQNRIHLLTRKDLWNIKQSIHRPKTDFVICDEQDNDHSVLPAVQRDTFIEVLEDSVSLQNLPKHTEIESVFSLEIVDDETIDEELCEKLVTLQSLLKVKDLDAAAKRKCLECLNMCVSEITNFPEKVLLSKESRANV